MLNRLSVDFEIIAVGHIELKEKPYTLLELDLEELGEVENFVKSKYARLYRQSADGVDPVEREKAVRDILRTSYTAEELNKEMVAYDVLYYVVYLMLRHNPGVTRAGMSEIVDQSNIQLITTAMDSFGDEDENPPAQAEANH